MRNLDLLNRMPRSETAGHGCGDRQGCLKGTRTDVLRGINHWLTDGQDQRVFWLSGLAGTGKSTTAQTFAETSFADGKLGASFFCSRDFEDRSNLHAIFPTLAYQLARRYPSFREGLLQVLKTNPDAGQQSLCSQIEMLIIGPFKAACIETLIIIDALGECRDMEPASAILSVLSRYVGEIPNVKFFITGRPEARIRSGFRLKLLRPITEVLELHEVERSSADDDIKLFFRTRLAEIAGDRNIRDFGEDWPSWRDIDILCEKAGGFFIYASTVIKFVASEHHHPPERLTIIISLSKSTSHEGRMGVDLLYTQVLTQAFDGVGLDEDVYSRFRLVVGAVLLALYPLSVKALSELLVKCGSPSSVSAALRGIHSLLLIPADPRAPIRVFHKSFVDFLTDSNSGSEDNTIRLWGVRTGKLLGVITDHQKLVTPVSFSPTDPSRLVSASLDFTMRQWGVDGHQFGPLYGGIFAKYSPDGNKLVSYVGAGKPVTFRDSHSGNVIAELHVADSDFNYYCLSPDGKFMANAAVRTVYIWDTASSHLISTFVGHLGGVTCLACSSSLISASDDKTVKFWQIGASSIESAATDTESASLSPALRNIESVSLHAIDRIATSSNSAGEVKKWDISTGRCDASFETRVPIDKRRDVQLINGRVIVVWHTEDSERVVRIRVGGVEILQGGGKIHILDAETNEILRTVDTPEREAMDIRISGDGLNVFCLSQGFIRAWSIATGVGVGEVGLNGRPLPESLVVDGSRAWLRFDDSTTRGWDFGTPGSPPVPLSDKPPRYRLDFINGTRRDTYPCRIEDVSTGKEVFRFSGRYAWPTKTVWDGRYLVAGYPSGEVMVMDFDNLNPR